MSGFLPRSRVAQALNVREETLPPGDLPFDRLAERFLTFLNAGDDADLPPAGHPDAWTYDLFSGLIPLDPALVLTALRVVIDTCKSPEELALVAAGPLETLLQEQGPQVIDAVEEAAAGSARFAFALTGVWTPGQHPADTPATGTTALLWARVDAARRGVPALDDGAPLPPPG